MKLSAKSRTNLCTMMQGAIIKKGLKYKKISQLANVDTSQVSRICRGHFRTLSQNVVQICNVLQIDSTAKGEIRETSFQHQLQSSILNIWDRSPEDAERLMEFMNQLRELRRTGNPKFRPAGDRKSE